MIDTKEIKRSVLYLCIACIVLGFVVGVIITRIYLNVDCSVFTAVNMP